MTRFAKFGFAVAVALVFSAPIVARADDKDVIDYRQHVMKTLDEQVAAIGMIVSTQIPDDNLVQHAQAISLAAKTAMKAFQPKVLGGESKPGVWENWADFSAKMTDFVKRTDKLALDAKSGGVQVVMEQMVDALTCKGCHDTYREKK